MPGKLTLEGLTRRFQSLKDRLAQLEKDVRALKDLLNVHDNWHSAIRRWIGSVVTLCDRRGEVVIGKLKWSDRYNLCVEIDPALEITAVKGTRKRIYTKGGIIWLEGEEG